MSKPHKHEDDESGEPGRKPELASGGSGAGSGGGSTGGSGGGGESNSRCVCGFGKLLDTTYEPSMQNIVAGIHNQLPKSIRGVLPLGRIPICEIHKWK